jgi:TFIIF-interacting CTD phosphatase-like protein
MLNQIKLNKPIRSTRPDKKKMVYVKDPSTGKIKTIHFGARGYRHNYSEKAWRSYIARASGIRDKEGNLTKDNKLSANYWAIRELWPGRKGWKK